MLTVLLVVYAAGFALVAVGTYRWLSKEEQLNAPGDGMLKTTAAVWAGWAWPLLSVWLISRRSRR